MTPFETELKRALARHEPPEDFSARVLARVPAQRPRHWFRWTRAWVLVVAAALLLSFGGIAYQRHERAVRGQAAKQKLLVALQIAGSKLHQARQQVMEVEGMEIE